MPPRKRQAPAPAAPEGDEPARREGRVFVTLPRLLRERLRATLEARGWLTPEGQPQRGAETEIVTEWLMDYARLRGWGDATAPPREAPGGFTPPTGPARPSPASFDADAPDAPDDDFGFND
jgi:hypothetical protein